MDREFKIGDRVYHEHMKRHGIVVERTAHTHPSYVRVDFGDKKLRVRKDSLSPLRSET